MTIFNQPPPRDTVHYSKAQLDSLIPTFAPKLIDWANAHGRHDLPWQQHRTDTPDIYAIWLSEIMLQQTQVATVKGYFSRFVQQFADVHSLANADWDEVANLWAGLGYYARARNLHAGARQLSDFVQTHGHFPNTLEQWCAIKGVGRSTAGAVLSMGVGVFGVICDANVKRVLARIFAVNAPIDKHEKQFWHLATALTPVGKNIDTAYHSGRYAQAIMDLGALICQKILNATNAPYGMTAKPMHKAILANTLSKACATKRLATALRLCFVMPMACYGKCVPSVVFGVDCGGCLS